MIDNNRFHIRLEIVAATTTFVWLKYTSYINFLIKFAAILVRRLTHRNGQKYTGKDSPLFDRFYPSGESV